MYKVEGGECSLCKNKRSALYQCDHCGLGPICWTCMQDHKEICTAFGMF